MQAAVLRRSGKFACLPESWHISLKCGRDLADERWLDQANARDRGDEKTLAGGRLMGLRESTQGFIRTVRGTLALKREPGSDTPADQCLELRQQMAELRGLLEETRRAVQENKALISRLREAGATGNNPILDGLACFISKDEDVLDGPFCKHCFEHDGQTVRLVPASKPQGKQGPRSEWVRCPVCRTPFRSPRVGEYLNAQPPAPVRSAPSRRGSAERKPRPPASRPATRARRGSQKK